MRYIKIIFENETPSTDNDWIIDSVGSCVRPIVVEQRDIQEYGGKLNAVAIKAATIIQSYIGDPVPTSWPRCRPGTTSYQTIDMKTRCLLVGFNPEEEHKIYDILIRSCKNE